MRTYLLILFLFIQSQMSGQFLHGMLTNDKSKDTGQVNILLELSANYSIENPDKAIYFAEKALKLSRQIKYSKGIAKSYSLLANNYNITGDYISAIQYNTEAINSYNQTGDKKNIAEAYRRAGSILSAEGLWDESRKHYNKALDIYFALDDKQNIARVTGHIKMLLELEDAEQDIPVKMMIRQVNNKYVASDLNYKDYGNAAIIMYFLGNYDRAVFFFLKGVESAKKNKNADIIPRYLSYLGLLYKEKGDIDKAIDCFINVLNAYKKTDNKEGTTITDFRLGQLYEQLNIYDKALNYYLRAANNAEIIKLDILIPNIYKGAGNISFKMKSFNKAEEYYTRSLDKAISLSDYLSAAEALYSLGEMKENMGLSKNAVQYFLESIKYSDKAHNLYLANNARKKLAFIAARSGDYKKAFEYHQEFLKVQDSITSFENKIRIRQLEARYILESKENEILMLKKDNEIINLTIKNQNITRIYLIAGIIIISFLLILLYNRFSITRKNNILLKKQRIEIIDKNAKLTELNRELETQKKIEQHLNKELLQINIKLRKSEESLIETNKAKDKFFSIISHDLRSPFATIVSFAKLLRKDISKFSKEDLQEMAEEFSGSVSQVNNLLENLLQWSRTQTGKIQNNAENINMNNLIEDSISLFASVLKEKELLIKANIEVPLNVWADRNMLDTVMRNLISNATKYSYSGQEIKINGKVKGNYAEIEVADQGVGISEEDQHKLFKIESAQTTFGTNYEKGSGLGLLLCHEFVERMGGTIKVKSKINHGSSFIFTIPVAKA